MLFNSVYEASPISGSPNYDTEFETKWTKYDPNQANALLDEIGLTERDADGFRLRPDGKTLQVIITTINNKTNELELVKAYWEAVGIKTVINKQVNNLKVHFKMDLPTILLYISNPHV